MKKIWILLAGVLIVSSSFANATYKCDENDSRPLCVPKTPLCPKGKMCRSAFGLGDSFEEAGHEHHAKHGFILMGEEELFASHLVYKVPHHYQVLLKLELRPEDKNAYLTAKRTHSESHLIFLLDRMDISQIASSDRLTGSILVRDADHEDRVVISGVVISRSSFEVIYLEELPLSLDRDH